VVVGITGNYLSILSHPMARSVATAVVGAFYYLGGLFILAQRKWGAVIGVLSSSPRYWGASICSHRHRVGPWA
jgi:hypothetical protein